MSIGSDPHPRTRRGPLGTLQSLVRGLLPRSTRRFLARTFLRATRYPPIGAVRFGSLRRLTPISTDWGFDRGTPIDRHYIERFLEREAEQVQGHVLEIDTADYTRRFGGDRVRKSDVLHIAEMGPGITMVGDLTSADHLPSETFDCIILTQTLQLIHDTRAALTTAHRLLKPGGVVLLTMPGISPMTGDPEGKWGYHWGFTTLSARTLLEDIFTGGHVEVSAWGNVLTASAFLYGLAAEELTDEELAHRDPTFELLVTARARRADTGAPGSS